MMSVALPFNIVPAVENPGKKRMTASFISIRGKRKPLPDFWRTKIPLGRSVRVGYLRSMAFGIACQRGPGNRPNNPPYKGWSQAFYKRHPELIASKQQALDWR
jgi:hypothetical protein